MAEYLPFSVDTSQSACAPTAAPTAAKAQSPNQRELALFMTHSFDENSCFGVDHGVLRCSSLNPPLAGMTTRHFNSRQARNLQWRPSKYCHPDAKSTEP